MKNIFKFAAMAFAAVLLVASCEKKEPALSIDGKQWVTELEGTGVFLDLGLKKKDTLCSGYCDTTTLESMMGMSVGTYTVTATDATSGSINVNGVDPMTGAEAVLSYKYKDLTESTVKIDFGIIYNMPTTEGEIQYADFKIATKTIEFEDMYDNM